MTVWTVIHEDGILVGVFSTSASARASLGASATQAYPEQSPDGVEQWYVDGDEYHIHATKLGEIQ